MKIALIILGCIVGLFVVFVGWRYFATVRGGQQLRDTIEGKVGPVVERLRTGGKVDLAEIEVLAASAVTRNNLYRSLTKIGRKELFPEAFNSLVSHAESDLVVWLMHPNELGAAPAEIVLAKVIQREEGGEKFAFCVFKFRETANADSTWIAGVAGPYFEKEDYSTPPPGVFSRFEAFDSKTPEGHLDLVEKMIPGN